MLCIVSECQAAPVYILLRLILRRFRNRYIPLNPLIDLHLDPNECHQQCSLLFWTVVAIGSRRYTENPTLIVLLAPKVFSLAKSAIFTLEPLLLTLQALIYLCSWPMPFETISNDLTPTLAGVTLQVATIRGLHVKGVGQEFARKKLNPFPNAVEMRERLWTACSLISARLAISDHLQDLRAFLMYRRVTTMNGSPPVVIPDTYGYGLGGSETWLSPSIQFQRKVSNLLSATVLKVQDHTVHNVQHEIHDPLERVLQSAFDDLAVLEVASPEAIGEYTGFLD